MRKLKYSEAICEAHVQALEIDERVFIMGQGVDNPWCVGTTTKGILKRFGALRVRDVPISESAMTGAAIGAAMAGMRPLVFHPRMDFMYLAMDQIINHGALWYYMFGGRVNVPVTIRAIINRGNEQAAQHSQSPYAMYAHVPGLKIVLPSTPYDAKGLLLSAIMDENPVLYLDDRWLYDETGEVPAEFFKVPIGKGIIRKKGSDVTILGISYLACEAVKASKILLKENINAEVIDLRSVKPIDIELILESVRKTKRLLICDPAWPFCGVASEIACLVSTKLFGILSAPVEKITLPEAPAPASTTLEKAYYPDVNNILDSIRRLMNF